MLPSFPPSAEGLVGDEPPQPAGFDPALCAGAPPVNCNLSLACRCGLWYAVRIAGAGAAGAPAPFREGREALKARKIQAMDRTPDSPDSAGPPVLPWNSIPLWQAANRSLAQAVGRHRPRLAPAMALAGEAFALLGQLAPVMTALGNLTCSRCLSPCCEQARVWFDFRDLLYLHLTGQPRPPAQLREDLHDPCRYLGAAGCRLPRQLRPWVCTWYLCPSQTTLLGRGGRHPLGLVRRQLGAVAELRREMETAFIRAST